jgi:hypothetical protein
MGIDDRVIAYIFRGKLETEVVNRWKARERMTQLNNCTLAEIYFFDPDGEIYVMHHSREYRKKAKSVPEEIKLAAMLL